MTACQVLKQQISKTFKSHNKRILIHKDLTKHQSDIYKQCKSITAKSHSKGYHIRSEYVRIRVRNQLMSQDLAALAILYSIY